MYPKINSARRWFIEAANGRETMTLEHTMQPEGSLAPLFSSSDRRHKIGVQAWVEFIIDRIIVVHNNGQGVLTMDSKKHWIKF